MPPQSDPNDATVIHDPSTAPINQTTIRARDNLIGVTLGGRYLIEQELARGGMGAVYLARDKPELLSRRVVIKVLLEDSLKDEWVVKKFRQEIESLTRLDDPGVVGIFDAGTLDDGSPYLVMQYVDGANLRTALKPEGMEFERAANIIRQIGRTLTVAHEQGIVHRDLKPENIMLRLSSGGEEQVKIIDFGIAKVKNSAIAPTTLTGAGTAGTVAYMSPEQFAAKSIAAASDIYALGVIAYEMLAGRRPFNPETSFQLAEMQKAGVQVSPRALRPAIPEKAEQIILKALSYRPADRPQRARDFGDELARALTEDDFSSKPVEPESTRSTLIKPKDKQAGTKSPVPLWMIAALFLLVAGIIGVVVWLKSGSGSNQQANASNTNTTTATATAPRTLVYSLTVQKMDGDKTVGDEYPSIGQESFGNGWRFRVNLTPAQSGSLYMLNEFSRNGGAVNYNALFPTKENNNGVAELAADRKWQTGWYHFPHQTEGAEKFWIIWSQEPLSKLDAIFKDAANHELVISDPAQVTAVQDVLARYNSSRPEMETDAVNKRITLKGKGDVLVSLLELKHEKK
jgi:serine/threonine protein kinase